MTTAFIRCSLCGRPQVAKQSTGAASLAGTLARASAGSGPSFRRVSSRTPSEIAIAVAGLETRPGDLHLQRPVAALCRLGGLEPEDVLGAEVLGDSPDGLAASREISVEHDAPGRRRELLEPRLCTCDARPRAQVGCIRDHVERDVG